MSKIHGFLKADPYLSRVWQDKLFNLFGDKAKNIGVAVVNQIRGRAFPDERRFSIPMFAIERGEDFATYYMIHEFAHILNPVQDCHGPSFMRTFRSLCPEHLQHFELNYKPRNAKHAGIKEKK